MNIEIQSSSKKSSNGVNFLITYQGYLKTVTFTIWISKVTQNVDSHIDQTGGQVHSENCCIV